MSNYINTLSISGSSYKCTPYCYIDSYIQPSVRYWDNYSFIINNDKVTGFSTSSFYHSNYYYNNLFICDNGIAPSIPSYSTSITNNIIIGGIGTNVPSSITYINAAYSSYSVYSLVNTVSMYSLYLPASSAVFYIDNNIILGCKLYICAQHSRYLPSLADFIMDGVSYSYVYYTTDSVFFSSNLFIKGGVNTALDAPSSITNTVIVGRNVTFNTSIEDGGVYFYGGRTESIDVLLDPSNAGGVVNLPAPPITGNYIPGGLTTSSMRGDAGALGNIVEWEATVTAPAYDTYWHEYRYATVSDIGFVVSYSMPDAHGYSSGYYSQEMPLSLYFSLYSSFRDLDDHISLDPNDFIYSGIAYTSYHYSFITGSRGNMRPPLTHYCIYPVLYEITATVVNNANNGSFKWYGCPAYSIYKAPPYSDSIRMYNFSYFGGSDYSIGVSSWISSDELLDTRYASESGFLWRASAVSMGTQMNIVPYFGFVCSTLSVYYSYGKPYYDISYDAVNDCWVRGALLGHEPAGTWLPEKYEKALSLRASPKLVVAHSESEEVTYHIHVKEYRHAGPGLSF